MNKCFALLLLSSLTFQAKAASKDLHILTGVPMIARAVAVSLERDSSGIFDKLASGTLNASVQRRFVEFGSVSDYSIDTALHAALLAVEDTGLVHGFKKNKILKSFFDNAMLKSFAYCAAVSFIRAYASSLWGSPACTTPATEPVVSAGTAAKK